MPRMFSLLPKETVFFDLFEKSADNVQRGAQKLLDLMGNFSDLSYRAQEIKEIEHAGDKLTHDMIERMNKTFVTPLDREDIHELACRLDDILDLMDTATARMALYKVKEPMPDAVALARVLVKATTIIKEAMPLLRTIGKKNSAEALLKSCIEVHTQENEGDRIEQHALASLFENGLDPITVIKWKDIFQDLEAATDRCEDVANAIESIVLKNC
jgi:predicted phosphate transport protein (TIGR00153 family)